MSTTSNKMRGELATQRANQPENGTGSAEPAGPPSTATLVRRAIEKQSVAFRAVLPKHVDPERFARLVLTAVKSTPDLLQCWATPEGQTSVLLAASEAAALGLEPNTPTQDCWLLPRRDHGKMMCRLAIGYRGYLRLARRSGSHLAVFGEVVHAKDTFDYERGLQADRLEHKPYKGDDDPGPLTNAYAVVRYVNGGYDFVVLARWQVEQRRAMSDSWKSTTARPYSPWTKWPEAMWRKTALRTLTPSLDLSPEFARALAVDETTLRFDESEKSIEYEPFAGELGAGDAEVDVPEPVADEAPEGDGTLVPGGEPFE